MRCGCRRRGRLGVGRHLLSNDGGVPTGSVAAPGGATPGQGVTNTAGGLRVPQACPNRRAGAPLSSSARSRVQSPAACVPARTPRASGGEPGCLWRWRRWWRGGQKRKVVGAGAGKRQLLEQFSEVLVRFAPRSPWRSRSGCRAVRSRRPPRGLPENCQLVRPITNGRIVECLSMRRCRFAFEPAAILAGEIALSHRTRLGARHAP